MTIIIETIKMTDRPVVATCPLGSPLPGTGMSAAPALRLASLAELSIRERNERATKALLVTETKAPAHVFTPNGAGGHSTNGQKQQHLSMWAFRGLEPWSDPV
ncbi:hypothetical protein QMK19_13450 [Streptomyces sp. H10-C2]|uniref:hypothetical protein n=1 Tax=unclassified Streptomyces TaxID=2593676 RepID=UPI0024BB1688|nr:MULTISPECIES: hypothetical protein [unclassified Streptomyces]MDJ0343206.1 hypothetical protein [Streptomyces sp. PH10-H1]MDJ0370661.1 hypothetical protein [Streptomyces sp. H10-C2]